MSDNSLDYSRDSDSDSRVESIDNEPISKYKPGGYYPVSIGEIFNTRYRIIKKLGWGAFSTVWLVYDYQDTQNYKVLKIVRSDKNSTQAATEEADFTLKLNGLRTSKLLDMFKQDSIFGTHTIIVFNVYGENLLNVIIKYRNNGLGCDIVKKISKQLLEALVHIHDDAKIIHTDIKPENILVASPSKTIKHITQSYKAPDVAEGIKLRNRNRFTMSKSQKKRYRRLKKRPVIGGDISSSEEDDDEYTTRISDVKMVDFGNSQYITKITGYEIQTRYYRSPEVIITNVYSETSDVWSTACTIFELLTGDYLFSPKDGKNFDIDDDHLAQMIELTTEGEMSCYKSTADYHKFFNKNNELTYMQNVCKKSLKNLLKKDYQFIEKCATEWSDFLLFMLHVDYTQRPSARKILDKYNHWLVET